MGTNYYYHTNICEHCHRSDGALVGEMDADGIFHFFPTGAGTVGEWARIFKTTTGTLVDQNEVVVSDPLQFLTTLKLPASNGDSS